MVFVFTASPVTNHPDFLRTKAQINVEKAYKFISMASSVYALSQFCQICVMIPIDMAHALSLPMPTILHSFTSLIVTPFTSLGFLFVVVLYIIPYWKKSKIDQFLLVFWAPGDPHPRNALCIRTFGKLKIGFFVSHCP